MFKLKAINTAKLEWRIIILKPLNPFNRAWGYSNVCWLVHKTIALWLFRVYPGAYIKLLLESCAMQWLIYLLLKCFYLVRIFLSTRLRTWQKLNRAREKFKYFTRTLHTFTTQFVTIALKMSPTERNRVDGLTTTSFNTRGALILALQCAYK